MEIKKEDIMQYAFYNEQKEYTVILNINKLKEIFNADNILLEEKEHR